MTPEKLPSLEQLIRKKIQRRILAAMILLVLGAVIVTVIEAALSYSNLVARLDRRADTLQDSILSEVLVNNHAATRSILADANREHPDQNVDWIALNKAGTTEAALGLTWRFPGNWSFVRPLKRLGDQDFGTFVFSGNFFTSGGLVSTLTHRLAFTAAICILMGFLLLPIAKREPRDLILEPVKHLLRLVRSDGAAINASYPQYAEIKTIEDDFMSLMRDKRQLEEQRIETERLQTINRTAQMLAHDIRRPFNLLRATLDGLSRTSTPDSMRQLIEATVPGVKRSLEHLDEALEEFTTIGSPSRVKLVPVAVADFIKRGIESAVPDLARVSHRIQFRLTYDLLVDGVPNQLERVIANIVANAFEAMGPDDQVFIESILNSENEVRISVRNTGSYIPNEDLDRIFHFFYTKGKPTGTGVGLAICRRILRDHGGSILCKSSVEDGTCFLIRLPVTKGVGYR